MSPLASASLRPFPVRTLSVLCVAAAASLALGGCETSSEVRSKVPKSSAEKKSSSKSPVKWESSSTQTVNEDVRVTRIDAGVEDTSYDGQRIMVTTVRTGMIAPEGAHPAMTDGPDGQPARVPAAQGPTPATPPVMLGVRMRAIDPVLATHLGVDPRGASVLEDVAEELNGHAGGLRDHDVIVAVDGKTPADPGSVRKVLRSKKPGETIDFTVIRPGGKTDVKVTLEAFDHGKFMSATPARVGG